MLNTELTVQYVAREKPTNHNNHQEGMLSKMNLYVLNLKVLNNTFNSSMFIIFNI